MKKNNQLILITGGLGFIGLNLAKELTNYGYSVVLFDNLSTQIHGPIPKLNDTILSSHQVSVVRGDITEASALRAVLDGIDVVVHLASETGTAESMYQIARYNTVNSQGTAVLLDLLVNEKNKVKKIVLASSRAVYGEGAYNCDDCGLVYPEPRLNEDLQAGKWELTCPICRGSITLIPTPETAKVTPASIYAATKLAQEDLIKVTCNAVGIGYTILRFQNVYGAGQSLRNPYTGILSIFSTRIRRGLNVPIFEDGLESRDFVYITDATKAIRLSIERDESNYKIINVGSGKSTSILEVANLLVETLKGNTQPEVTGKFRLGDIRHCYADMSLASDVLKFQTDVSLESGIAQFARWVNTQPLYEDKLLKANEELKCRGLME